MTLGLAFWILMLLWLVFGLWRDWPNHYAVGGNMLLFVVIVLLGWKAFGRQFTAKPLALERRLC